jgi:Flp pilus assembly protein TadD
MKLFGALSSQDLAKATQLGEQWLKQHPNDLEVRKAMADRHARAGNFLIARASYDSILKVAPDDGETLNNLANVLLRLKDPGALAMAERAVAKNHSNPIFIDTLGWTLFQEGHVERALQVLRDARLRAPDNPDIHFHLASVLAKAGRTTEAREEAEAALRGNKPFESAKDAEGLLRALR